MDSLAVAIETILLSIFIILFFYEQSRTNANQFIYSHPAFYFAIGIMIYLGGSFFFNILVHQLTPQEIARYQPLTYLGDIIKNILFSIGIVSLMRNPPKKLNQPSNVPYLDLDMK